jgi:hypothetical protein
MGIFSVENFKESTGGWRGALSAAGDAFSTMAVSVASAEAGTTAGEAFGEALGHGTQAFKAGAEKGKARADDDSFYENAKKQFDEAPNGSKVKEYWGAVMQRGESSQKALALLPHLWDAQAKDEKNSGRRQLTDADMRRDRQTLQARRNLIKNPSLIDEITLANQESEWTRATRPLSGGREADPDYERFSSWASKNTLATDRGEYEDWQSLGYNDQGIHRGYASMGMNADPGGDNPPNAKAGSDPGTEDGDGILARAVDSFREIFSGGDEAPAEPAPEPRGGGGIMTPESEINSLIQMVDPGYQPAPTDSPGTAQVAPDPVVAPVVGSPATASRHQAIQQAQLEDNQVQLGAGLGGGERSQYPVRSWGEFVEEASVGLYGWMDQAAGGSVRRDQARAAKRRNLDQRTNGLAAGR